MHDPTTCPQGRGLGCDSLIRVPGSPRSDRRSGQALRRSFAGSGPPTWKRHRLGSARQLHLQKVSAPRWLLTRQHRAGAPDPRSRRERSAARAAPLTSSRRWPRFRWRLRSCTAAARICCPRSAPGFCLLTLPTGGRVGRRERQSGTQQRAPATPPPPPPA